MAPSVMPTGAQGETIAARARELGPEAEAAKKRLRIVYDALRARSENPAREKLSRLINPVLVPCWKAMGHHEVLLAIQAGSYYERSQLEGCLAEARDVVVDRGRPLLLMRDHWKAGFYPREPQKLLSSFAGVLGPFYLAVGAVEELEALLA